MTSYGIQTIDEAECLEVRHVGGVEHYRVRWDDGVEGIFYPGSDAHSVRPGSRTS
jgi:hypothetical protein